MTYTQYKLIYATLALLSFFLMFAYDSLFLACIFFVFVGLFVSQNLKQGNDALKQKIDSLPFAINKHNFKADDQYLSDDFLNGIAINYKEEQLALFSRDKQFGEFTFKQVPFSSIIDSEIREDNVSVTQASKGSAIAGSLVGGAIAGGAGAIIGGLSGKKTSSDKAHKLTLLLTIDDYSDPYVEINFINNPIGTPKLSPLFDEARKQITKWHKTFSLMIQKKQNKMNF